MVEIPIPDSWFLKEGEVLSNKGCPWLRFSVFGLEKAVNWKR